MIDDEDADFRVLLRTLDPKARDTLRRALIHDEADRDAISPHRICKLYGWPQTFVDSTR